MWKNWIELRKTVSEKKVVYFGRGEWVEKTMPYAKFNSAFIVDNSKNEQNTMEHGLNIHSPEKLKEILPDKDEYYIIITTGDFYNVSEQLEKLGFNSGENFCVTPALLNLKTLQEIRNYDTTLVFSSADPHKNSVDEGGGIYVYNTGTLKYEKKISGITHGFCRMNGNFYIVDDDKGIVIYDKNLENELGVINIPPKSRPHGLAADEGNNLLYAAFSTLDAVGIFDADTLKMLELIPVSGKHKNTGTAWHHINDIHVCENSLYISMFSFSGNWKKGVFDGGIIEYDLKERKVLGPVVSNLWMPHNVKMIDGELCYLDSMRGNFHKTTHKIASHFNGFIRGLTFDGQFYIIGQSVHRYFNRMKEFSNNIALDCGFFVFDDISKGCRFYSLPKLYDIHTIDFYKDI